MRVKSMRVVVLLTALTLTPTGCGKAGPSTSQIDGSVRERLGSLTRGAASVRGQRLLQPKPVARFYEARKGTHAWEGKDAEEIVRAIRGIEADGLNPAEYHLETIERLMKESENAASPALAADLDILLTDAVAGMMDHVWYGRVRPVSLNPAWNVDSREGAPPVEVTVARIAEAGSPGDGIEATKPKHFIYVGLKGALANLREIATKGGWPTVRSGRPIKPGGTDPRIPSIRARLAAFA